MDKKSCNQTHDQFVFALGVRQEKKTLVFCEYKNNFKLKTREEDISLVIYHGQLASN